MKYLSLLLAALPLVAPHALEAVAQGDTAAMAASNAVLQGQLGANSTQLTVTNATVAQQASNIADLQIKVQQLTQLLSSTQTDLQQLKQDQGGRPGSSCGFIQWGTVYMRNVSNYTLSTATGSYIYTGGQAPTWPNGVTFPSELRYHVPCNGQPIVVNNSAHCPTGYTFSVIGFSSVYNAVAPAGDGSYGYAVPADMYYQGTCIKN